ncbi:ATP-binding protein [Solimonas marina]|uniref:ATP-binding protein n=1 Tax=Solimonas marina TaxID=2714601 RepID=A0A969WAY5_9GAMM|nr:ATP-binding protein [Solimonas marina]NKF21555.1 ATP-binding protein [Solimonas marina]
MNGIVSLGEAMPMRPHTTQKCEQHGEYPSYRFAGRQTGCPRCADDKLRKDQHLRNVALEAERFAARLKQVGIPPRYADAHLDEVDQAEAIRAWLRAARAGKSGALVVLGHTGTGKTHLACAAARYAIEQGMAARYTTVPRYLRQIAETWGVRGVTERAVHQPLVDAELLVLDELGAGRAGENDTWRVHDLIADRYDEARPTILISNLTPNELRAVIGDRAYDRIREDCVQINLVGESRRAPPQRR